MTRAKLHLTFPEHLIAETVIQPIGTEFGLVTKSTGQTWRSGAAGSS